MKKIIIVSVVLVAALIGVAMIYVYSTQPHIYYRFSTQHTYQKVADEWVTIDNQNNVRYNHTFASIYCQNKGLFEGSFDIIVTLINATFSETSFKPSTLISNTAIRLPYVLAPSEEAYTNFYFTVDENVTEFVISITLQPNQLMRYTEANWGGQSEFHFVKCPNNIWAPALIG